MSAKPCESAPVTFDKPAQLIEKSPASPSGIVIPHFSPPKLAER